jgi:hypothetical protein
LDRAQLARGQLAGVGEQVPSVLACFDLWADAVARFGECELHARALDRSRALDVFEERRPWLAALVKDRNEAGIEDLEQLRRGPLTALGRELGALELDQDRTAEVLDQFERQYREQLADWEMKGTDASRLMDQFVQIADVVRSSGLAALTDHLDKTFAELSDGRRQPNRGTQDNMPWWKWMALAGAVGWTVAAVIIWYVVTGQSARLAVTYGFAAVVIAHFVFLVLFC